MGGVFGEGQVRVGSSGEHERLRRGQLIAVFLLPKQLSDFMFGIVQAALVEQLEDLGCSAQLIYASRLLKVRNMVPRIGHVRYRETHKSLAQV